MHKVECERRARFSAQKADTTSKQPVVNACLHTTGGDVFQESVVDATKRELYAFQSEAKRWSQSDNRPPAPSASTGSATRMTRRILSEIYICICTCTCSFWYVI